MDDSFDAYFEYLKHRSRLGAAYRRFALYPRIRRHLSGRIVDVGCGIGDFLSFESSAVGLDVNPRSVQYCVDRGLNAYLIDSNGVFPFPSGAFDSALLDNVLEHIHQPRKLLAEISRILKPSGRLLIGVPGVKGYRSDPDHKVEYTEDLLVETVEVAGFRCEALFAAPLMRSRLLSRKLRLYCTYARFVRIV